MKSNRGTKRGCVWNNNTCCHWAGDASPRTCRTLKKKIKKNNFNKNERFGSRPASCTAHALNVVQQHLSVSWLCVWFAYLHSCWRSRRLFWIIFSARTKAQVGFGSAEPPPSSSEDLSASWGVCECGVQRSESVVNIIHRHRNQIGGSPASTCTCGATIS